MLLNLTDLSDEPLQSQISRQIRAKILSGELTAGESLPSIRVLARKNQVSVITVQRAYEHLDRDELIHSRRGKGFFVSELKQAIKKKKSEQRLIEKMEPLVKNAISEGLDESEIRNVIDKLIDKNLNKK